jgi:hypothetical protein
MATAEQVANFVERQRAQRAPWTQFPYFGSELSS